MEMVFDEFEYADNCNDEIRWERYPEKDESVWADFEDKMRDNVAPDEADIVGSNAMRWPTMNDIVGCDKCGLGLI